MMKALKTVKLAFATLAISTSISSMAEEPSAIEAAVASEYRTEAYAERDGYRNPAETLAFFQIEPEQTVVEIWPGGGWYTEILAPLLKDKGQFYAAGFPADSEIKYFRMSREKYDAKLAAEPKVYSNVTVTELYPPKHTEMAPAGSADRVLTFRNVHNWMKARNAEGIFSAAFTALKPGGMLGVVEHRAAPETSLDDMITSGYVTEQAVIEYAEQAGFELAAKSEVNANAADTKDHPKGVWTLPPSLRLGDEKRDHYTAIGESDRMTLLFKKPE